MSLIYSVILRPFQSSHNNAERVIAVVAARQERLRLDVVTDCLEVVQDKDIDVAGGGD
jgi:hypothetical protein